ncbi:hypothetical protein ACEQ8H_003603 [Pleosporales sp. CAS-2024a]
MIAELDDFEVYVAPNGPKARSFELLGLHHLEVPRSKKMFFDGFLRVGEIEHYVEGIPIDDYSIEGYGNIEDSKVTVYIQSASTSKDPTDDVWYRLQKPSCAYSKHHKPFLWVAQLSKHVLDFIEEQPRSSVGLHSFRQHFGTWLKTRFQLQSSLEDWYYAIEQREDFRVCITAYIDFIYQQAYNLPNSVELLTHPLWAECMAGGQSIIEEQERIMKHTLATPYVHENFKHMYFGGEVRPMQLSNDVKSQQRRRLVQMGFSSANKHSESKPEIRKYGTSRVHVGEVVAFHPDRADMRIWKNADWEWLLYVTDIQYLRCGTQRLFGLYLYRPRETNILTAQYRYQNELFFSDNCNCKEGALLSTDVNGQYQIEWSPSVIPHDRFFVRQAYITQDSSFTTLTEQHKICECKNKPSSRINVNGYQRGDSAYVVVRHTDGGEILEPVIITAEATHGFIVRRFARLQRDFEEQVRNMRQDTIADNELVLTDTYERVAASDVQRQCQIRFIHKDDLLRYQVPFPYNRKGAGDYWFFSMGETLKKDHSRVVFLSRAPSYFREGSMLVDTLSTDKLIAMSLFGGGGNFDRGVEDGGAVDVRVVVEWDLAAISTQRANARDPDTQQFFCGSVDDHLNMVINGVHSQFVLGIGEINMILAGFPCPGYSTLQQDIFSPQSLRNASRITTICSYVDVYRPEYAVFENVVSMAHSRKGLEDQNVLSQLVACFVSMGYQVNQYIMDAWNYGSCQQRSRVIFTIAAPGLCMIQQPKHTHSLPRDETAARSLGVLPNGQRFGNREYYATPFPHVSAEAATLDLPDIGNGNIQTCVSHPNHRVSMQPSRADRALVACIPHDPPGCGYKEAFQWDLIPASLQKPGKESGNAYRRIRKSGLVPTITTGLSIQDSRNGATLHWEQNRPITILEVRRTQGYPDHEPIIGNLAAQYRILGNGVDRHVAFPLGLSIRKAMTDNVNRSTCSKMTARMDDVFVVTEAEDDHLSEAGSDYSVS